MSAQKVGLLIAAFCVANPANPALAGTTRQMTSFLVPADERAVCQWIERNSTAIDESTGAEVLAVRGKQAKLRKQTKEGPLTFVVQHDVDRPGQYQTVLLKSDNANLVSEKTEIQVQREGNASRVTITVVATVENHTAVAIAMGIRPSLRAMRNLLQSRFGSQGEP
jgi:hypothetical protein